MTSEEALRRRYRFKMQPLWDRDETAILVFKDLYVVDHPDYRVGTYVLTIDEGWMEVQEHAVLPMEKIPTIAGYDTWHEGRMLTILDDWEHHIRAAIKADTGVELKSL